MFLQSSVVSKAPLCLASADVVSLTVLDGGIPWPGLRLQVPFNSQEVHVLGALFTFFVNSNPSRIML